MGRHKMVDAACRTERTDRKWLLGKHLPPRPSWGRRIFARPPWRQLQVSLIKSYASREMLEVHLFPYMKIRIPNWLATLLVLLAVAGHASAQDCYQSSILTPSPFMGNNKEIFKLADGSLWEVKYEYEYLYKYYPSVIICPSRGKLIIGKTSLDVQLVSGAQKRVGSPKGMSTPAGTWEIFEETNLQGSISGTVQQGRIFKTTSGNVYEVAELTLQLVLELQPEVMVLRNGETYKLIVKGFDEPVICKKLNKGASLPKEMLAQAAQAGKWELFEETNLQGSISGTVQRGRIFKTTSGNVYEVTGLTLQLVLELQPGVMVLRNGETYKLIIKGFDEPVICRKLN